MANLQAFIRTAKQRYIRAIYPLRKKQLGPLHFYTEAETFDRLRGGDSLSRFGDGELLWMMGQSSGSYGMGADKQLAARLRQVMTVPQNKLLVGILMKIDHVGAYARGGEEDHGKYLLVRYFSAWKSCLQNDWIYVDACMTRCYASVKDKSLCGELFDGWKSVWAGRPVLVVEGENTRFGVGNDLLADAAEVKRVLAPGENAWAQYPAILEAAKANAKPGTLVLAALGPAATVLAYDLCEVGIQTIDIGHLDIEYEWYTRGTRGKAEIPGKYVNELAQTHRPGYTGFALDKLPADVQAAYQSEIVARVGVKG